MNFRKILLITMFCFFIFAGLACLSTGVDRKENDVTNIINNFNGEEVIPRDANKIYCATMCFSPADQEILQQLNYRIKEKIRNGGRLVISEDKLNADLMLKVILIKSEILILQQEPDGTPINKKIIMKSQVSLINLAKNNEIIFKDSIVDSYLIFSDTRSPVVTEESARRKCLEELAERIFLKMSTGWYSNRMTPEEGGKTK